MEMRRFYRYASTALVVLLCLSVLWKGGKGLEMTWLLVVVCWAYVLGFWATQTHEDHPRDVPSVVWALTVGFVLWTIVSFSASQTRNYGLDEVLRDGSLALLFLSVTRSLYREPSRKNSILISLALSACIAALVGFPVYILQPVSRFVGSFFDYRFHTDYWPNAWAEFLLLSWPIVLLWAGQARKCVRSVRFALLGIVLGTLLLSFSRGAMLTFVVQTAFVLALLLARRWHGEGHGIGKKQLLTAVVVLCIAGTTFVTANVIRSRTFSVESVARKVTFTADDGKTSVHERSQFWSQAFSLAAQRPWVGHGPYSFRFLQTRLQKSVFATSDHPHNVFLKLAAERGWPTALIFLSLMALVVIRAISTAFRRSLDVEQLACLTAAIGVLVHNLIDYNLQFVGIALPFWFILACIESRHLQRPSSLTSLRARRAIEVMLITLLCIVALAEAPLLLVSSFGRHEEASGNFTKALQWYEVAKQELFSRDLHLSRAALFLAQKDPASAQKALEEYFLQNAEDARGWMILGEVRQAAHDDDGAQQAYERAIALGGYDYLRTLRLLLELLRRRKNAASIEKWSDPATTLLQEYATAIGDNTHFIALSDNVEEFLKSVKLMEGLYPDREAKFQILAAAVDRHAKEERAKYAARQPGGLW